MPSTVVRMKPYGLLGPGERTARQNTGDEAHQDDPQNAHMRPQT